MKHIKTWQGFVSESDHFSRLVQLGLVSEKVAALDHIKRLIKEAGLPGEVEESPEHESEDPDMPGYFWDWTLFGPDYDWVVIKITEDGGVSLFWDSSPISVSAHTRAEIAQLIQMDDVPIYWKKITAQDLITIYAELKEEWGPSAEDEELDETVDPANRQANKRRLEELGLSDSIINPIFDLCMRHGWQPELSDDEIRLEMVRWETESAYLARMGARGQKRKPNHYHFTITEYGAEPGKVRILWYSDKDRVSEEIMNCNDPDRVISAIDRIWSNRAEF